METKICSKCSRELPLTNEYFHIRIKAKSGFTCDCKDCRNKQNSKWRDNNREYSREFARNNYQENKEACIERSKKYYLENKENIKAHDKVYYSEHKERYSETAKAWKKENKEHLKEYGRKYYADNREHKIKTRNEWHEANKEQHNETKRIYNQKRRIKVKELPKNLSSEQWLNINKYFNNSCAYCGMTEIDHIETQGEKLHQEHFLALSKGGEYTHNNIIPVCRSCNSSKGNKDFFEWYPKYKHYDKNREQFILEYLGYIKDIKQLAPFR